MQHLSRSRRARRAWWLFLSILTLTLTVVTTQAEINIGTLHVGTDTYHNVSVTSKTADSIFITHSRGYANVRVSDVGPEILAKLGYDTKRVKVKSSRFLSLANLPIDPKLVALKDQFATRFQEQWEGKEKTILATAWCVLLAGYLFFCFCSQLICQKAGGRPGIAIWIPIVQFLPILQAAGMSAAWLLLALLPVATPLLAVPVLQVLGPAFWWVLLLPLLLPCFTYLIWSVKICRARGIGQWVALLLILPWTNVIAYLYLAFSSAGIKARTEKPRAVTPSFSSDAQDTAFFLRA